MQQNTQIPLKSIVAKQDGHSLQVNSIFYTIQGEGPFAGHPCVFVRLAGCNLQCPGCDTEYTIYSEMGIGNIIEEIEIKDASGSQLVIITGGEPFRQDISVLVRSLVAMGYHVQIETNGTLPPPERMNTFRSGKVLHNAVTVVCSPKTGTVNKELLPFIKAYKYVAAHPITAADGLPDQALFHTAKPKLARPHEGFAGDIYLQPMDEQDPIVNERNTKAVVESCLTHGYKLCLQLHKIVGVA